MTIGFRLTSARQISTADLIRRPSKMLRASRGGAVVIRRWSSSSSFASARGAPKSFTQDRFITPPNDRMNTTPSSRLPNGACQSVWPRIPPPSMISQRLTNQKGKEFCSELGTHRIPHRCTTGAERRVSFRKQHLTKDEDGVDRLHPAADQAVFTTTPSRSTGQVPDPPANIFRG